MVADFASLLVYSPRGESALERASRERVCYPLKSGDPGVLARALDRIEETRDHFPGWFGPDVVLVPVPRSAPLRTREALWPAREIVRGIVGRGLARAWHPLLTRTVRIPKAAWSPGVRRTVTRQLESMAVDAPLARVSPLADASGVTIVDDVITSGATLFGAVQMIRRGAGKSTVRAFAMVRTVEKIPDSPRACLLPTCGTITMQPDERTLRDP